MSKKKKHGHRLYQPPVNRFQPGQVRQAYSWLFPAEAQKVVQRVREWDTAYLLAHPYMSGFCRRYVPGEGFPHHDTSIGYVAVFRHGNERMRAFLTARPRTSPMCG